MITLFLSFFLPFLLFFFFFFLRLLLFRVLELAFKMNVQLRLGLTFILQTLVLIKDSVL